MFSNPRIRDYIFCRTCQVFVDFWKYAHDISDAGHALCDWRYVTDEELVELL